MNARKDNFSVAFFCQAGDPKSHKGEPRRIGGGSGVLCTGML